jgi:hypothetical protein
MIDMKPADPIEGILISQWMVANQASRPMYRRAWVCDPAHYFEAHKDICSSLTRQQPEVVFYQFDDP